MVTSEEQKPSRDLGRIVEWLGIFILLAGQTALLYGRFVSGETNFTRHEQEDLRREGDKERRFAELCQRLSSLESKTAVIDSLSWRIANCEQEYHGKGVADRPH